MKPFDRLPALPLIANDPYFSVWLPADKPTDTNTVHWTGASKALRGTLVVDGTRYRFLGRNGVRAAETLDVRVTPTKTCFVMQAGPVQLDVTFWTPALPDDLDTLTTPITFVDFALASTDGKAHDALLSFNVSDELCYDGPSRPQMISDAYTMDGLNIAYAGRAQQNVLGHSGDLITIDIPNGTLTLHVSDEVLAERKKNWKPVRRELDGYLRRYAESVKPAAQGAWLD